ncbi:MAG: hypothetical protein IJA15_03920 [Clostridia bacterium]|nr:hypothetical protein [Clostridia bacterium]
MTVKEVIKLTAETVGEDDVVSYLEGKECFDIDYAKKVVNLLIKCYNLITDEIACEYFPQKQRQDFNNITDKKIPLSSLNKTPLRILRVFAKNGQKLGYKLINDYIEVNNSDVTVEYLFKIPKATEDDEAYFASTVIGPYVLAYGIASQYLMERGRIKESEIYNEKYMQALRGRLAERSSLKIPQRRWM